MDAWPCARRPRRFEGAAMKARQIVYEEAPAILRAAHRMAIRLDYRGFHISEWRVHPLGAAVLQRQIARGYHNPSLAPTIQPRATLFGSPLYVDSAIAPRRIRAIVEDRTYTVSERQP